MRTVSGLFMLLALACGGSTSSVEPEVKVSDDRTALQRHIKVPDGLHTVRWAARPRGTVGLGPTDLELLAWFPLNESGWTALADALGPEGEPTTLTAPDALKQAIQLDGEPTGADVPCTPYETSHWRCVGAIRRADGVLVYLVSS